MNSGIKIPELFYKFLCIPAGRVFFNFLFLLFNNLQRLSTRPPNRNKGENIKIVKANAFFLKK